MSAHAEAFLRAGYPVEIIAGRGGAQYQPDGAQYTEVAELDSQHTEILAISGELQQGHVPAAFAPMRDRIADLLREKVRQVEVLIAHNVMTKHFNLPLTAALYRLMDEGALRRCIAWTHDMTWSSPNSRSQVFPGMPWDLLRSTHPRMRYVTIAEQRQRELASLLGINAAEIPVVHNGVDPVVWYGFSEMGRDLIEKLDLLSADLILLMPVRITQAKNIEFAMQVAVALRSGGCQPRLVVTGPPDPHHPESRTYYQSLLELRSRYGLEQEVTFIYEQGETSDEGLLISQQVVAELMRASDVLFLPSHREGFGMPVLEAGLLGLPVVASENVPAALEIGGENVRLFAADTSPEEVARLAREAAASSRTLRFRQFVRKNFTWGQLFRSTIEPLLLERSDG
jgi:glycosyltransferase involved in cell wall biosynthesis